MASYPSMPLWTDAYLADTRHLSTTEHGAYLMLLMVAWRRPDCDLPDDDKILARFAGLTSTQWKRMKPTIMEFWNLENERWTQKRLLKERVFVRRQCEQRSTAANARWLKLKESDNAAASPPQCGRNAPTPTPSSIVVDTSVSTTPPNEDLGKREPSPDDLFESWYKMYPRKVGKGGARKAFKSALKKADYETLCRGRDAFIEEAVGKDKSFIPYAATWLNQERWTDDQKDINPIPIADGRSVAYISSGGGRPPESIVTAVSDAVARRSSQF